MDVSPPPCPCLASALLCVIDRAASRLTPYARLQPEYYEYHILQLSSAPQSGPHTSKMPPKRAPNTAASFTRSVNEVLDGRGITSKEQISDSLLRKLYRLQDAPEGAYPTSGPTASSSSSSKVKAIHNLRACTNAWDRPEKRKKAIALEVRKISKGKRKADDTTDDSDSDVERAKKASLNGGHDGLDPWCDRDRCKDNPRCLNWLGQYQWEASAFAHLLVYITSMRDPPKLSV